VRIAHLSDLHISEINIKDIESLILPALVKDLKYFNEAKEIDLIVISGDLIDKGGKDIKSDEPFDYFRTKVLSVIENQLEFDSKRIIFVPGNHDMIKSEDSILTENGVKVTLTTTENINDYIDDGATEGRKRVIPYKKFEREYHNGNSDMHITDFYSQYYYDLDTKQYDITLFNSAWRCYGGENEKGQIILGERQILDARDRFRSDAYKIGVIHHGLDFFAESENAYLSSFLQKDYDLILLGHVHKGSTMSQCSDNGETVFSVAPSNWSENIRTSDSNYKNGYSIIDIAYDGSVYINHRRYAYNKGEYVSNTDLGNKEGISKYIRATESESVEEIPLEMNEKDIFNKILFIKNFLLKEVMLNCDYEAIDVNVKQRAVSRAHRYGQLDVTIDYAFVNWLTIEELFTIQKDLGYTEEKLVINKTNSKYLTQVRNRYIEDKRIDNETMKTVHDIYMKYNFNESEIINCIPRVVKQYPLEKDFESLIGRESIMRSIFKHLNSQTPITLTGMGGIGKTAIVQQLIYNLQYGLHRPFKKIFFMSFKETMFDFNDTIKFIKNIGEKENQKVDDSRLYKLITNYNDLISRLCEAFDIELSQDKVPTEKEEKMWELLLNGENLLILDNIETEEGIIINRKILKIAQKFLDHRNTNSRLLITSRNGLNDSERKIEIPSLGKESSIRIIKTKCVNDNLIADDLTDNQWIWLKDKTNGIPMLLLSFAVAFRNSNHSLDYIISNYDVASPENRPYKDALFNFMAFCFENTFSKLDPGLNSFKLAITYFAKSLSIYDVNEHLIGFILREINGITNVNDSINVLHYIGLLKVKDDNGYKLNKLMIEYINRTAKTEEYTTLKEFRSLLNMIKKIQNSNISHHLSISEVLEEMYIQKFVKTEEINYLNEAYYCYGSIDTLTLMIENSSPKRVLEIPKLLRNLDQGEATNRSVVKQNQLALAIILQLKELSHRRNKKYHSGEHFLNLEYVQRSSIIEVFDIVMKKLLILKIDKYGKEVRKEICNLFVSLGKEEVAEQYLKDEIEMVDTRILIYSKIVGKLDVTQKKIFEIYMDKIQIERQKNVQDKSMVIYRASLAKWYFNNENEREVNYNSSQAVDLFLSLDEEEQSIKDVYNNYLKSLVFAIVAKRKLDISSKYVEELLEEELNSKNLTGFYYEEIEDMTEEYKIM